MTLGGRRARSLAVEQAFGQRIRQPGRPDRGAGAGDVVFGAPVDGPPGVEIQLQPGRPRIAVPGLADAAGLISHSPLLEAELLVRGSGLAGGGGAREARERQGHVRMADQGNPVGLNVEAQLGLERREDVFPHRVAGAGVIQADRLVELGGLQTLEVARASPP